jgi:CDP-glucose 4,6-dehydratase
VEGDVRDESALARAVREARPEIVFHLAAQPIVRRSYEEPVLTFATNVMGTVNLLEAVRRWGGACAVVCITSDKCYENPDDGRPCREGDPLGGHDPYSSSKGCAEFVVSSYRRSYFRPEDLAAHGVALASARAGNVIGGGDWARDRLVPDLMRGFAAGSRPAIRFAGAVRPWQHVLEPLGGYMALAERLYRGEAPFAESWNFGPDETDAKAVDWVADRLSELWGEGAGWTRIGGAQLHEARFLLLDCAKARSALGWRPRWALEEGLRRTVDWYKHVARGADAATLTVGQIRDFTAEPAGVRADRVA